MNQNVINKSVKKPVIRELILGGLFTALTAVCAQLSLKLPFSPVPITFQVFAVCFGAAILRPRTAVLSQISYLLLGLAGAPVFSAFNSGPAVLLGPNGGYLLSFPVMALLISFLIKRDKSQKLIVIFFTMFCGLLICYSFGVAWLGVSLSLTPLKAIILGAGWFLPLDIIKIILASILTKSIRSRLPV
ncbi:MAG: biotin transporter BioY [Clostridiales bacterium]|nr:biotin transporter BioY [Clostridiales bacterium]